MPNLEKHVRVSRKIDGFCVATDYADKIAARAPAPKQLGVAGVEYAERELESAA